MEINKIIDYNEAFQKAIEEGNAPEMAKHMVGFMEAKANEILADAEAHALVQHDAAALAQRGYRQLTAGETKFYERFAEGARGSKQQFIDVFEGTGAGEEIMPETIIEEPLKDLAQEHPLLKHVKIQYIRYSSKWILNDSAVQKGAWGQIDAKITAEVKGALKVIDLSQNKYSAFAVIPLAIIDLGPTYIDAFLRAVLLEAIAYGLEEAILMGSGVNMPIGLTRNPNGALDQETGYPEKEAVVVTSFEPSEYGALVAKLAKTEGGKYRKFTKVQLICNQTDYLTKVMPATTVLNTAGQYVNDRFPFPTEVIPSVVLPEGTAILCLLGEYTLAAGRSQTGIEFDDSIGFLDHTRAFRWVGYFAGRAYDNTCAVVLNIASLEPAFITVKNPDAAVTA